jgi:hypothetical protein
VDPERLAALLDGRLSEEERLVTIKQLSQQTDEDLGVLADAAGVLSELESANEKSLIAPPIAPQAIHATRSRSYLRWPIVLAAGILVAVGATTLMQRSRSRSNAWIAAAPAVATDAASLLEANPPWQTYRAGEVALTPRARATRIGRTLVDLEIARRTTSGTTAHLAAELADLLLGVDGAATAAATYRAMATGQSVSPEIDRATRSTILSTADEYGVRAGSWLEATRAAAVAQVEAFFTSKDNDRALGEMEHLAESDEVRSAVRSLRDAERPAPRNWSAIDSAAARLLGLLGR